MKYIITFTGPAGTSKTPISYYLSQTFNLPIFNNDTIRTEVTEDLSKFDEEEFRKRAYQRLNFLIKSQNSFILDASIDREYKNYIPEIQKSGYKMFTISLDISKEFIKKLYQCKKYQDFFKNLDQLMVDHQNFLKEFSSIVNLSITDKNFLQRLELSENSFRSWLNDQI